MTIIRIPIVASLAKNLHVGASNGGVLRFDPIFKTCPALSRSIHVSLPTLYSAGTTAAAAATNREKRSLTVEKHGVSSSSPSPPPPTPPTGGSSTMLPIAAVAGAATLGGAYYYFNKIDDNVKTIETSEVADNDTNAIDASDVSVTTDGTDSVESKNVSENVEVQTNDTIVQSATDDTTIGDGIGKRVIRIEVPQKMKNVAEVSAPSNISHPAGGNRVTGLAPKTNASNNKQIDDFGMTQESIKELKETIMKESTDEIIKSYQQISIDEDASLADLDSLTMNQLKVRIVQLASELKDRTKWEAIRLKEFLVLKEKETSNKYLEILQKQRLEYEDMIAKKLREQENELLRQMQRRLHEKDDSIQSVIQAALDVQKNEYDVEKALFEELTMNEIKAKLDEDYSNRMEGYKTTVQQDLQQKFVMIQELRNQLSKLESSLEAGKISREGSSKAHRVSAAALALSEVLESSRSAENELKALKIAAGNEGVISTAVSTIPEKVAKYGVPTIAQLQARFDNVVYKKSRQAALVPPGRVGLEGQLAGILFASLKYPPDIDEPTIDETIIKNPEYVIERARRYVQTGDIELAVDELEKLSSLSIPSDDASSPPTLPSNIQQALFVLSDWKQDAIYRIAIEKALKVIKMECALMNESCL